MGVLVQKRLFFDFAQSSTSVPSQGTKEKITIGSLESDRPPIPADWKLLKCQSVERILEAHHPPKGGERRQRFKEIWEVLGERRN